MRRIGTMMLGLALLFAGLSAMAEDKRSDVSLEGTGLFTQESNNRGISQRATEAGGLLVGYRYHFNDWIAAEANYGYSRNTQNFFNNGGLSRIQSNIHEATAAFVFTPPAMERNSSRFSSRGQVLSSLIQGTGHEHYYSPGAQRQAKAAFVYGGGVDYDLAHHVALRAEYRGLVYKTPVFNIPALMIPSHPLETTTCNQSSARASLDRWKLEATALWLLGIPCQR